ncbi:MAG: DUF4301 family protein [Bacteroidota bacterium]
MFSDSDLAQIKHHGLTSDKVLQQIDAFRQGYPPANLQAPALEGSGIMKLTADEKSKAINDYEGKLGGLSIVKFVPASGAATRMFKKLFGFVADYKGTDQDYEELIADQGKGTIFEFFKRIEDFAFYQQLSAKFKSLHGKSLQEAQISREYVAIIRALLEADGLDYGALPKGLLSFHKEGDMVRTPVEEHIVEGCQYAKQSNKAVSIHFTVSPEHMDAFKSHVEEIRPTYESTFDCKLVISYSVQNQGTDTIAVTLDNEPFRNDDGTLLFRPAGHGALLENLNAIDADVVFLKNIDNIVPDRLKADTIEYKKVIGGILLQLQERIFGYLAKMQDMTDAELQVCAQFIEDHLGWRFASEWSKSDLVKVLNRPIRVCGVVKSDGDPGGGPFWVQGSDGNTSLQIVETAQINLEDAGQQKIFSSATHFNPVDVVCSLRDFEGQPFDLMQYYDPLAGFVTEKSKDGKALKAQELPGLWNGSMAHWNTIFVEVPVITFNPVKAVNDLLKEEHQG